MTNLILCEQEKQESAGDLAPRKTIYDLFSMKCEILNLFSEMEKSDKRINEVFKEIDEYDFYEFRINEDCSSFDYRKDNVPEKIVDRKLWRYIIKLFELHKYMLCTEYKKLTDQIERFESPTFNIENAESFLLSLKGMIYKNIQDLIEDVFNRITTGTYKTGSGWYNEVKKKRNNNGIDKWFILRTHDCSRLSYWRNDPTITDDLEKACYLIGGETLPKETIIDQMRKNKTDQAENKHFRIRVCSNGNTHYWIKDEIRKKLNFYGAKRGVIGDNIKIKIFERER